MNLDIFKTPKQLPFLHCTYKMVDVGGFDGEITKSPSLSLDCGSMPIIEQPSIEDIWTIEDNENIQKAKNNTHGRISASIILRSAIAFRSRRASGNILIVPNSAQKYWYDMQHASLNFTPVSVIVDASLEPNELRATYWKIIYDKENTPIAVDGGIQLSPEGFSAIQSGPNVLNDYHSYFRRGFM